MRVGWGQEIWPSQLFDFAICPVPAKKQEKYVQRIGSDIRLAAKVLCAP